MDPLHAHFLVMVGEACQHARTGQLAVVITLRDGREFEGVPTLRAVEDGNPAEVDHTGYARQFVIGGTVVELDDVVELHLKAP
jgi:hypothetical protein